MKCNDLTGAFLIAISSLSSSRNSTDAINAPSVTCLHSLMVKCLSPKMLFEYFNYIYIRFVYFLINLPFRFFNEIPVLVPSSLIPVNPKSVSVWV